MWGLEAYYHFTTIVCPPLAATWRGVDSETRWAWVTWPPNCTGRG